MKYVVTFDVGTTAVKGALVSSKGEVLFSQSETIDTIYDGKHKEQDPRAWYDLFCRISRRITNSEWNKEDIIGIIMSGQMQDVILVDSETNPIGHAILYSDGRAEKEAERVLDLLGSDTVLRSTANNFDGTIPLAKLLWLKNHRPRLLDETHKVLISSKDFCVLKLTGEYCTDYTSATTSGMMDIAAKTFNEDWLTKLGLNPTTLPRLNSPASVAGKVTLEAAQQTGYAPGTIVYAGIGDAGATTLASGIKVKGEVNINLGTSGWVATIGDSVVSGQGVFNLVSADKGLYINVVPFLNAGNAHNWISTILQDAGGSDRYANLTNLLARRTLGSNGLLFLPYLVGERFPVMDSSIKGCYYGITPETEKADLATATLEGVAFSIRQGLEQIVDSSKKITLIGGGAREKHWCQILADILGQEIQVFANTEFLSAVALADLIYEREVSGTDAVEVYLPIPENVTLYNQNYQQFKQLYPRLKGL